MFLFKCEHLVFQKLFPAEILSSRCAVVQQQWPTRVWSWCLEGNRFSFSGGLLKGLYRFFCLFLYLFLAHEFHSRSHFAEHIYYCMDIHYRAAGNTAGKHGSPVAFSSRWKHSAATAAVALETWSLSLFYPHSLPLASLSALLPAIRIKPAAELAVLKHSLQLNTLK